MLGMEACSFPLLAHVIYIHVYNCSFGRTYIIFFDDDDDEKIVHICVPGRLKLQPPTDAIRRYRDLAARRSSPAGQMLTLMSTRPALNTTTGQSSKEAHEDCRSGR